MGLYNWYGNNPDWKEEDKYKTGFQEYKEYFENNYQALRVIGRGSYGVVYLIQNWKNKKDLYAMKIIQKDEDEYEEIILKKNIYTKIGRDIMVMSAKCNNPFLLKIKCAFQDINLFYIISEYIPGKDLEFYVREDKNHKFNK